MKTLYELLEVSETASKEIIEKAYKVLAKKYHPDLQEASNKTQAEEMMKKINEAYDVLSDETKRKRYDEELALKRQSEANNRTTSNSYSQQQTYQQPKYYQQANNSQNTRNSSTENANNQYTNEQMAEEYRRRQEEIQHNIQQQYEAQYQKAYENYLRSLGYRIKYKWTWKRVKELLKTIGIIIAIVLIILIFPPTRKLLIEFYESNSIVKTVVDIIGRILVGTWKAICSIFKR